MSDYRGRQEMVDNLVSHGWAKEDALAEEILNEIANLEYFLSEVIPEAKPSVDRLCKLRQEHNNHLRERIRVLELSLQDTCDAIVGCQRQPRRYV